MADTANAGGGNSTDTSTQTGGAAQTDFKVPDGKVLLDATEHQRLTQNNERVRGMQPYWETGSKYGIKKPEDLEPLGRLSRAASKRGIDMGKLIEAMEAEEQAAVEESTGGAATFDVAKFKKELGGEFISRADFEKLTAKQQAKFQHDQLLASEKALIEKTAKEILGDKANPWNMRSMTALLESRRGAYPTGHPLSEEHLSPYDEKSLSALLPDLKKEWASVTGAEIEQEADAALKGKRVPTVAGSAETHKSKNTTEAEPDLPGTPGHTAKVRAAIAEQDRRRGGGTVSSLGG